MLAVLDWELSTTGQPLADLAYFLMPKYLPRGFEIANSIGSLQGIEGNYKSGLMYGEQGVSVRVRAVIVQPIKTSSLYIITIIQLMVTS